MTVATMFERLKAPFPPDRVSWRVGSTTGDKSRGLALAYIDARDVMERLDAVCGEGSWQCRYPHANGKTVCEIGIWCGGEWIWKANGAGDTDIEAEKGALSDAFKRAAVCWGIGRYLYDVASPWVELEPAGKSYKIKESELPKLQKLLGGAPPATNGFARAAPPAPPDKDALATLFVNAAIKKLGELKAEKKAKTPQEIDEMLKGLQPGMDKYGIVMNQGAAGINLYEAFLDYRNYCNLERMNAG